MPNIPSRSTFPAFDLGRVVEQRLAQPRAFYRGSIGAGTGAVEAVRALERSDSRLRLQLYGPLNPESFATKLHEEISATGTEPTPPDSTLSAIELSVKALRRVDVIERLAQPSRAATPPATTARKAMPPITAA